MTLNYFANGKITAKKFRKAHMATRLELENIAHEYLESGWEQTIGASGTIRSVAKILHANNWSNGNITREGMEQLKRQLLSVQHIDQLQLDGLSEDRRPVMLGGFVVLYALFDALEINEMEVSDGAVREGLIYDLIGKSGHDDVREFTVRHLINRYLVRNDHAHRVEKTALNLYNKLADKWSIRDETWLSLLSWAARLHEMGLAIAHNNYHLHGAYLAQNSDLAGFSFQEQQMLAILIQGHREKVKPELFEVLNEELVSPMIHLCIILRISVILHRSHSDISLPEYNLEAGDKRLILSFPQKWLDKNPLTVADLKKETRRLKSLDFKFEVDAYDLSNMSNAIY